MNEQTTLLERIGTWFKRGSRGGDLPLQGEVHDNGGGTLGSGTLNNTPFNQIESRSTFLRPWAKRDQAIQNLQDGFHTLTDLMSGIRDNMERHGRRQDELLTYLSSLPQVLEAIPESTRVQGEALKAIHQQLAHQNVQQSKLSEILDKLSENGGESRETLEELKDRVEQMRSTDAKIADNLGSVGEAMRNVSDTSRTSAQVLTQLRENLTSRDTQLEQLMQKQNARFTTMLAIAIFLSVAAIVAVSVIGYLLLTRSGQI